MVALPNFAIATSTDVSQAAFVGPPGLSLELYFASLTFDPSLRLER
ncbi:hypothetical protein J2I47_04830 [Fibrella sp. HMF5335]|uniref:Uncharacterized protein n=1 Tax=Fibrella rubiginis TaxID=2817060 RepID=A0A939GFK1_9BACT|nr:hypothetical protein [Fibrella rubiginis]MBO0935865.1 hypothetical protein [Fibrella rubiginis]